MYFSNHNENITFSTTWGGLLEVCGKGAVVKEDAEVNPGKSQDMWDRGLDVSLTDGITSVGPGFLEHFTRMRQLIIHYSVKDIAMTKELKALLKKNRVLVRGWFDSYGERFAKENGLRFLHTDLFVGWDCDEDHYTHTKLTIRFNPDGTVTRQYDDYCPGISAGNNGGGTWEAELESDFYVNETLQGFAERLPRFTQVILKNKDLAYFFRTASKRK